ncbi:MAG TPA: AEC family transporter, partial [Gammaproteobacteria bacterium]|nr:AEC family transporter [Gammaproteobacteria bacterium]
MAVFETVLQMMTLVALGAFWRWRQPGRVPVAQLRSAVTELVYHLLLPALVLRVLWQAEL